MGLSPSVRNVLLLDSEGKRVAVKYFSDDWPTHSAKLAFERSVFTKTSKTNARSEAEIAMFDGYIVVYRFVQDLHFFVTASDDENELILATVLQGFYDAVGNILRNDVEKRTALENLDLILLCIDEIIDGGIILETDGTAIAGKVATNSSDSSLAFFEQNISQALAAAREHFARSFLKCKVVTQVIQKIFTCIFSNQLRCSLLVWIKNLSYAPNNSAKLYIMDLCNILEDLIHKTPPSQAMYCVRRHK